MLHEKHLMQSVTSMKTQLWNEHLRKYYCKPNLFNEHCCFL